MSWGLLTIHSDQIAQFYIQTSLIILSESSAVADSDYLVSFSWVIRGLIKTEKAPTHRKDCPHLSIILNNRWGVATPTTTISLISGASESVVKTEHAQS